MGAVRTGVCEQGLSSGLARVMISLGGWGAIVQFGPQVGLSLSDTQRLVLGSLV